MTKTSTSYARRVPSTPATRTTAGLDWTAPLYFLLGPAPTSPEANPMIPLNASAIQ